MKHRYGFFVVVYIDDYYDTLTKGKEYEVGIYNIIEQGSPEEQYIITNDEGYDECFYTDSFKRKNEIRDEKLKKLGI